MEWIIIAGILQGLLEWLPVSSSGQVSLYYMHLAGLPPGEAYRASIALHLGTGLGALALVWREMVDALKGGGWRRVIIIPTIVSAPIGLAIMDTLPGIPGDLMNAVIGLGLIATGALVMGRSGGGGREVWSLSAWELAVVGLLQGLAAIPGLSRSALTIAGFLGAGVRPWQAVKASILIGVPVTAGAGLYEALAGGVGMGMGELAVGVASSALAGALSAGAMLAVASRLGGRLGLFLVVMGLMVLAPYLPLVLDPL